MLHGGGTDPSEFLEWLFARSEKEVTNVHLLHLGVSEDDYEGEGDDASHFEVCPRVWAQAGVD